MKKKTTTFKQTWRFCHFSAIK